MSPVSPVAPPRAVIIFPSLIQVLDLGRWIPLCNVIGIDQLLAPQLGMQRRRIVIIVNAWPPGSSVRLALPRGSRGSRVGAAHRPALKHLNVRGNRHPRPLRLHPDMPVDDEPVRVIE